MRALVVGGTSRIAHEIIHALLAENVELTVLTGRPWSPTEIGLDQYSVLHGIIDLSNYNGVLTHHWIAPYDLAIFVAPLPVCGNLLPFLPRATLKRAVFISSYNTRLFGHTPNYQRYVAAEEKLLSGDMPTVILQPTMITGRWQDMTLARLIRQAQKYGVIPLVSGGHAKQQPLHYKDLARAVLHATQDKDLGPGRYGVGGPDVMTQKEMAVAVFDGLGKPRRFLPLPRPIAASAALALKAIPSRATIAAQLSRAHVDKHVTNDALPNWRASITLPDTLAQLLASDPLDPSKHTP